jgi:hypothetical protein
MTNLTHNSFFMEVYFNSLHVSSKLVLIIRRNNCISTTSGMSHTRCFINTIDSIDTINCISTTSGMSHTRCFINTIHSIDTINCISTTPGICHIPGVLLIQLIQLIQSIVSVQHLVYVTYQVFY